MMTKLMEPMTKPMHPMKELLLDPMTLALTSPSPQ